MEILKKASILIVDDNSQNLQLMGSIIYENGYNVSVSSSGERALQSINQHAPDLILLDIKMPGMNGFEVCKALKANPDTKDIPVIFLTAITDSEILMHSFNLGAVDYITKPFKKGELLARVATHIELKLSKEKLKELNATKDKFFSIISHDLRNPASALKSLLEQMTTNFSSFTKEEIMHYLMGLQDASGNLFGLLEDLLLWSKSQWGVLEINTEKLNLQSVVDNNIAKCNSAAKVKNIEIKSTVADDLYVEADQMMLNTIIINLLSNAIKFSKNHGLVELSAKITDKQIELSIRDYGIGINKKELSKLFSIDLGIKLSGTNNEEVSGLGLILCKDFAERIGGVLSAKSEKGKGSTFILTVNSVIE